MHTGFMSSQGSPSHPAAFEAGDKVEIIIHRDKGGVRASVHASYIDGRALKQIARGEGGGLLLDAVDRCVRAIRQAGTRETGLETRDVSRATAHPGKTNNLDHQT